MTSKEALELLELILNNHSMMLEVDDNRMECINVIKQDLERLEVLEIENQDLKDNEKIITDYGFNLVQENEKLKNAIDVFAKHLQLECGLQTSSWLQFKNGDEQSDDLTREEYKLLKDVLGNKI